jgi:Rieske Fe-S protein
MNDMNHRAPASGAPVGCGAECACSRAKADRRTFLAQGAAALAALALAACGVSAIPTAPSNVSATAIKLSDNPTLAAVGGVAVLTIGGTPLAIVHETSTSFSAFSLVCPHAGNTVQSEGAQGFYCPGHGARYSLTGQWIGGQPTSSLRSYPVQYNAATGTLTVGG